jgi:VIT1/CCC1 family predicted Fe2+/Mn2+ transporter
MAAKLNWLRAGVLGANDGIVSTAGIVMGVAGAEVGEKGLLIAGLAGLAAGAMSMAAGEYVSVSTQRDSERAALARETHALATYPEHELAELADLIAAEGIQPDLAHQVAVQLTEKDALAAHARFEYNIDPNDLTNPISAAVASFISFICGAVIPLVTILVTPLNIAPLCTAGAVLVAMALTGVVSGRLGDAPLVPATLRNIGGGALAMAVTYGLGHFIGA